jgi:hypothetical protein
MTIPQIHGFLDAIQERNSATNAMSLANIAVGAQGDPNTIKKTLNSYTKSAKRK